MQPPSHFPSLHTSDNSSDDEGHQPALTLPGINDHNLLPSHRPLTPADTIIPTPYLGSSGSMSTCNKSNIPPGPRPFDRINEHSIPSERVRQQEKKRVLSESPWGLTGGSEPSPKRQNTIRPKRSRGMDVRESNNVNHETSRNMNAAKKSEELMDGLAGGSTFQPKELCVEVPEEDMYDIPQIKLDQYQDSRMQLDSYSDVDDELTVSGGTEGAKAQYNKVAARLHRMPNNPEPTSWIGKRPRNRLSLQRFRRGEVILEGKGELFIVRDKNGDFLLFNGEKEFPRYGFSSREISHISVNPECDYVDICLNRNIFALPRGRNVWLKLLAPCPDIKKGFLKDLSTTERATKKIEERESELVRLQTATERPIFPPTNVTTRSGYDKGRDQDTNPKLSNGPKDSKPIRITRNSNMEALKRKGAVEIGDADNRSPSPKRSQFIVSKEEMHSQPLVWPPSGKKRVTVDPLDLERLDEGEFLNDNIINFYLRYLEEELIQKDPATAQKTHFFNTFFYERLIQKTADKRAKIQALMKWTARVDLFTKHFVIIPINENAHWFLAIICNLHFLEEKLQVKDVNGEALDTTVFPAPDLPGGEDDYSEPEPPHMTNAVVEGSDPNGSGIQKATTAEDQLLSEASVAEKLPEVMEVDQHQSVNGIGDENEWPNEDGLEGAHTQHIGEFKLFRDSIDEERLDKDSAATNTDDAEKRRGKTKKKKLTKPKKLSKPSDPEEPTIFILDSLSSGAHSRTFSVLKEYLEEEARQKKQWSIIGRNINGIYAKVPKQPNWCDCGVFLLHYVERFLDRPKEFIQDFFGRDSCERHFESAKFSGMRQKLMQLIIRLCNEQHGSAFEEIVNDNTVHGQLNSYNARGKVQEFSNMNGGTSHRPRDDIGGRSMPKQENNVNKQGEGMLRPLEEQEPRPTTSKHFRVEIPAREISDTNDYHQPHSLCSTLISSPSHKPVCTEGADMLLLGSSEGEVFCISKDPSPLHLVRSGSCRRSSSSMDT